MSDLNNFYKDILISTGLSVTEDGFVKLPSVGRSKSSENINIAGKTLVLPMKEHFDTLYGDVNGKRELVKTIFNPLKEDVVKGDSTSLLKLKSIMELRLGLSISNIFTAIVKLAMDKNLQKNMSLELSTVLGNMKEAKNQNITNVIDNNTLDKINKLTDIIKIPMATKGHLHLYIKKGGKINDVKYNRLALASFPMYDELCNYTKDGSIYDVKLRPKDVKVFKIIYEYIFNNINVKDYYTFGSTDKTSPGFVSLFKLYLVLINRTNEILNLLSFMGDEISPLSIIDVCLEEKDIDNLARFDRELAALPDDSGSNRSMERLMGNSAPIVENTTTTNGKLDPRALLYGNQQQNTAPKYMAQVSETPKMNTDNMTTAQKILYGNDINRNNYNVNMQGGYGQLPQYGAPIVYGQPTNQMQQRPTYGMPVQAPVYGMPMQRFDMGNNVNIGGPYRTQTY